MRKMQDDVIINDKIAIPAAEIELRAVRSRGAGGQNVNKVASAIHLRWDASGSAALPDGIRQRLLAMDDQRITTDGVVVIKAREHRTQAANRLAAVDRLRELVRQAIPDPTPRKKTRPPKASMQQRRDEKRRRSALKRLRGSVSDD